MEFAMITGATSGIGYELAKLFAGNGYGLILVSSNQEHLDNAKERLKENTAVPVFTMKQNLTRPGAAYELFQRVVKERLHITVLVNNAGFGLVGATNEIDLQQDEEMIIINAINLVSLTKLFLTEMYKDGKGKILNVSSTGAFQPGPYTSTYFASKAFVLSYTRAVRYEAGKKGIQVSTLCPGATKTNFFQREGTDTPSGAMSAEKVAQIAFSGLKKNKEIIIPGLKNRLLQLFPTKIKMIGIAKMKHQPFSVKEKNTLKNKQK